MTDVKAQELSYGEWNELLEPYGWAQVTVTAPAVLFRAPPGLLEYDIRLMLKGSDSALGEWAHRSYLLEQARQAVEAVKARGYTVLKARGYAVLEDAPRIEFGGQYLHRAGNKTPDWIAEAELRFSVRLAR